MTLPRRAFAAAFLCALAASGCDGDPGGPGAGPGSLRFTYTGDQSGTFEAEGAYDSPRDLDLQDGSFAVGYRQSDTPAPGLGIMAYDPRTDAAGDVAFLSFPPVTGPQTFTFDHSQQPCEQASCPHGVVVFDAGAGGDVDLSVVYELVSGTIVVTSVSEGRIRGTFSGRVVELLGEGEAQVTGGAFDVPLLEDTPAAPGARDAARAARAP